MKIEFFFLGEQPFVALFNKTKLTEDEVKEAINIYPTLERNDVIIITSEQFQNVFETL